MAHLTQEQWDKHIDAINEFHEDAFQQDVVLKRYFVIDDPDGEDYNQRSEDVNLKGLIQYNYFRSWPMTQSTESGELDKESILLYLNIGYLESISMVDSNKNLLFDPGHDRFIINGLVYKAMGDSQAAQAKDNPLLIFIILKREETNTGQDRYV